MALRSGGYDPVTGLGASGSRRRATIPGGGMAWIPATMLDDRDYRPDMGLTEWKRLRCRHDFDYWCAVCARVRDKLTGRDVPFILNAPQRRVAAVMESDRTAGRPIRLILLKARQWGGSTLVQMYMAWIQSCHRTNWHSLICAHVKDTASVIRGMYSKLLANYPEELWDGTEKPEFKAFERAQNVRLISGRGCRVTLGSAERQESVRGADYAMAHLSETAFWPDTTTRSPADFIRAISGSIALVPYSLVVMESTANGMGNYFHSEWLRCAEGRGDKHAVFVPWYEIEIYRLDPPRPEEFAASLDGYERKLWDMGLCLDQIYWYRMKRREYPSPHQMMAEFPTTDIEAFTNTGSGVFAAEDVETLRKGCRQGRPVALKPSPGGLHPDQSAPLIQWEAPEESERYVVAVDVGGRSAGADFSVVAVLSAGPRPRVVAQWRGHCDHDILADTAITVARMYSQALLVVESNTLESEAGEANLYVLERMASTYGNIYRRRSYDSSTGKQTRRIGFHTNRATKEILVNTLISYVRDGLYEERDTEACNELSTYERLQNGSYAAKRGHHDDILMTRAIALRIISEGTADISPDIQRSLWDACEL